MLLRALVLTICVAHAAATWAQFPGGGRGGMGGGMGGARSGQRPPADRAADSSSPGALTQVQLDSLEDELKLTEVQRAPWNAYADRVQKLADATARLRFEARVGGRQQGTAVEQLERVAGEERDRMAALDEIVTLARAFYATLTPEQRALADRRLAGAVMALANDTSSVTRREVPPRGGR